MLGGEGVHVKRILAAAITALAVALAVAAPLAAYAASGSMTDTASREAIGNAPFGKAPSGVEVKLYTLHIGRGMLAQIAAYGGIVTSLTAPDRNGRYADAVLGYEKLGGYLKDSPYFSTLIGRYGNRIARGRFSLNGTPYSLATNDGPNSLHGGRVGFDKVVWTVKKVRGTREGPQLTLSASHA
jgi:aldose 1-epimerase